MIKVSRNQGSQERITKWSGERERWAMGGERRLNPLNLKSVGS